MKFLNLTKNKIKILNNKGNIIEIEPSGIIATAIFEDEYLKTIDEIDIYTQKCTQILNLPPITEDIKYLVTHVVQEGARILYPNRKDLLAPNTTTGAYKTKGKIDYVDSLISVDKGGN